MKKKEEEEKFLFKISCRLAIQEVRRINDGAKRF